jgi:type II secretory pathway pseudopilin PulG
MPQNQNGFSILEIVFLIVVVAAIGVVGIHFNKVHQASNNTSYFNALSMRTKTYYDKQAGILGIKHSEDDLVKSCYRTEQGPFDKGNLWCGIKVTKKINIEPDQTKLKGLVDELETVLKTQGFSVAVHGTKANLLNGFSVDAGIGDGFDPKLCAVLADYSPNTAYSDAKTSLKYSISCDNRASGLVPGFIDNSDNL